MADQLQGIHDYLATLMHAVEHLQGDVQTLKQELGDVKQEVHSLPPGCLYSGKASESSKFSNSSGV